MPRHHLNLRSEFRLITGSSIFCSAKDLIFEMNASGFDPNFTSELFNAVRSCLHLAQYLCQQHKIRNLLRSHNTRIPIKLAVRNLLSRYVMVDQL
ncbi:hypothetical protein D3C76_1348980 [compost metagenome]